MLEPVDRTLDGEIDLRLPLASNEGNAPAWYDTHIPAARTARGLAFTQVFLEFAREDQPAQEAGSVTKYSPKNLATGLNLIEQVAIAMTDMPDTALADIFVAKVLEACIDRIKLTSRDDTHYQARSRELVQHILPYDVMKAESAPTLWTTWARIISMYAENAWNIYIEMVNELPYQKRQELNLATIALTEQQLVDHLL